MVYSLEDGMRRLQDACYAMEDFENVQVSVDTTEITGSFGPNLENMTVDIKNRTITVEDYFTEVTLHVEGNVDIDYNEEFDAIEYIFNNGIVVSIGS